MSHRHVEIVIGRLVTDEEFRRQFTEDPSRWLEELAEAGLELTAAELTALRRTDNGVWRSWRARSTRDCRKPASVPRSSGSPAD